MKLFKWLVGPVALCIFVGNQGCTNKTANEAELVASKSDPDSANRNTANDESGADSVVARPSEVDEPPQVTLHVGDVAPPLQISQWLKGDAVGAFENESVYVVEFWATWCAPCKKSMPHLSSLQQHYSDQVTFIGISDEKLSVLEEFMAGDGPGDKTWDEIADYTIAIDGKGRATAKAYMKASGQSGIPTAFIVGRTGELEWIGHPMGIDDPLEKIVNDQWDRNEYLAQVEKEHQLEADMRQAMGLLGKKQYEEGLDILKRLVDANWDNAMFLNSIAWIAATEVPADSIDLAWAEKVAIRASELTQDEDSSVLDTVARVYYEQGNVEAAIEWQEKAVAVDNDASLAATLKSYIKKRDGEKAEVDDNSDGE